MGQSNGSSAIMAADLEIRPDARLVLAAGHPLMLSVREFQLLTALALRSDQVVSREELHAAVWGARFRKQDRSVDVYVAKLRVKLETALPRWRFIHTHFGFGYRFSAEPARQLHGHATSR
jgi:DNA-binding response OmpR family regulator